MDEYLQHVFEELYREDGLSVVGRGLGIKRLLLKFLQKYCVDCSAPIDHAPGLAGHVESSATDAANASASVLNPELQRRANSSDHGIVVSSSSGSSFAKKIVFCVNATGMEHMLIHGLLAEGLMPNQLPKVLLKWIHVSLLNLNHICWIYLLIFGFSCDTIDHS